MLHLLLELKKALKEQGNLPESAKTVFAEGNFRMLEYRLNKLKVNVDYQLDDSSTVNKLNNFAQKIIAFTDSLGYDDLPFEKQKKLMTATTF